MWLIYCILLLQETINFIWAKIVLVFSTKFCNDYSHPWKHISMACLNKGDSFGNSHTCLISTHLEILKFVRSTSGLFFKDCFLAKKKLCVMILIMLLISLFLFCAFQWVNIDLFVVISFGICLYILLEIYKAK